MTEVENTQLHASLYHALNTSDEEALEAVGMQIARNAAGDFPAFHSILNALGYHNRLTLVNDMMRAAWSQVQDDPSYSRPAVEAYASRASDHLIYAYLQREPLAEKPSPPLQESLERYFPIDSDRLAFYLQLLAGRFGRRWSAADFEPLQMPALSGLMVEFQGFAHRAGVPFARSHLMRESLPRYLLDRQAGNLQPKPDMADALRHGRRPFPQPPPEPLHPLAPDRPSLSLFLQRMLQTSNPQPYAAAATLLLVPIWLQFLQVRALIPDGVAEQSLGFLPQIRRELARFWSDHPDRALRVLA